jgi:hypothetical protein
MKRTALFSWLLAFTAASAFGQLPLTSTGIGILGPGGLPRAAIRGSAGEVALTPTGPYWFTAGSQAFTPDTGLEFHSAVYDPATKVMMAFGGIDWGDEDTGTNAVLLYAPAVLHHFSSTEGAPLVAPVDANNGTIDALYGVTGSRTTYRVTLPAGTYKQLPNNAPGPMFSPFLLAPDGYLYGARNERYRQPGS